MTCIKQLLECKVNIKIILTIQKLFQVIVVAVEFVRFRSVVPFLFTTIEMTRMKSAKIMMMSRRCDGAITSMDFYRPKRLRD